MLAVKIFDQDPADLTAAVVARLAEDPELGVELARYGGHGFGSSQLPLARMAPWRKSMHLHHDGYALLDLIGGGAGAALEAMAEEVEWAARAGVGAGLVTHVARTATVPRVPVGGAGRTVPARQAPDHGAVVAAVAAAARHAGRCGPLFIENTFESLDWFRELFRRLDGLPVVPELLGLCLDVGHCKVWSGSSLPDWVAFCRELAGSGRPLHVHAHANDGTRDQHVPLCRAEAVGLLAPCPSFCPGGMAEPLRELAGLCGADHFVLENSATDCLRNLDWALPRLA